MGQGALDSDSQVFRSFLLLSLGTGSQGVISWPGGFWEPHLTQDSQPLMVAWIIRLLVGGNILP